MQRLNMFSGPLIFMLVTGVLWIQPVAAEICNRIVAEVNDEVITLYELNTKMREVTGSSLDELKDKDSKTFMETRRKVLDLLLDEKITRQKVAELKINVTPQEVDDAIENIKRVNSLTHEDLIANLKEKDITYEEYRESIRGQLERMRLLNFEVKSKIIIREEKISQYYEDNIDQFSTTPKVHLASIFLKENDPSDENVKGSLSQRAEEIHRRIINGEDFGELAKEFSQGPGAQEGGDLGFFRLSQLDPELAGIIKDMAIGDVTEPIVRPSGMQIVKLLEKEGGAIKTFEEVRDSIYSHLYREELEKRYRAWIDELRKKAYTKIIF
ncbi:MAG: peptidylprolyl isomerase [Desulfatiglans sp.]|nr:peptidylprolyl isomerase [Thermodesulfobacteriota bacterium]MEE4351957.1 peptidylprolyl isomerase [Desulfatiglans sp.]